MGRNFVFGCFSFFLLFVFHAKSGTANNDRTGLSDISYQSSFSRDSNGSKDFDKFFSVLRKQF